MANSDPTSQSGHGFPWKAAGTIAVAVGILAGAHWYGDHSKGWNPSTFLQAWEYHMPQRPKPLVPPQAEARQSTGRAPGQPEAISAVMVDDYLVLDPFFAALWQLEQKKSAAEKSTVEKGTTETVAVETGAEEVVTVVHYGDSPTTADLITGDVREQLQERFGDAGYGFNLTAKPWAWYGHRHVEISDSGWLSSQKDATGVGRYKQGSYGLGGAVFAGSSGAHTTYTLTGAPQASVIVHYLTYPGGGSFSVGAGDATLETVSTDAPEEAVATKQVVLPEGATKVSLRVTSGTVKQFGVDFRTNHSGVLYDSLGLNGATTTILSRTFEPKLLTESLRAARPQLVVINYGTNESQFSGLVSTLEKELTMAIANIRAAAPGVPILIMSPMDRGDRQGGEIVTQAEIPQIVAIQKKVAAEDGCAFFDTYDAMGGEGTVGRWYEAQPRLMTADLIHPTPPGALLVANLLMENLNAGYDRWKRTHGIVTGATALKGPPVVAAPRPKPSPAVKKLQEAAPAGNAVPDVAPDAVHVPAGHAPAVGAPADGAVPTAVPAPASGVPEAAGSSAASSNSTQRPQ
ncbi:GDSL-type esterase/lipase family protein [Silvibacterium dinghuense]|uniref:SGNH hydrolase-type esterase domain-containing protein n=1 Tax=Silvibacterium dinghuense TaxID=1560006 RepID=A0A4Q1S9E7_9BACT|nr:GDSL-type esterase/lipase family protein [Silvibacterium dinghuense]RXS93670.1 hypothetical protein ESZ00_16535 [Silvibacterium dinghuense]GGH06654.1 hypothetical protein GCM10011586_23530 [Silvibacterium dinghuense]